MHSHRVMVVVVVVLVGVREHVLTGRTVNIFVTPEVTLAVSGETLKETTEDGASPRRGTGGRLKDGESRTGMEDKVIGGGKRSGGWCWCWRRRRVGGAGGGSRWIKDNCQRKSLCTYCIEKPEDASFNPIPLIISSSPLHQPLGVSHAIRDLIGR